MHNYSTYYANYTDPDKLFYGSITNALRGSLGTLAIFFNFWVICIFGTHKHLRTSKINWAVSNLMFSNILMCSMLVVYSFIKLTDRRAPYSMEMCLVLNWFMVSVSFGPTWSIVLMTSLRALFYSKSSKKWDEILTLKRLIILRLFLAFLDVVLATVVIFDVTDLTRKTHCAYQIMLEKSSFYVLYNLIVGILLLICGLASLITRMKLRRRLLKNIKLQAENGAKTTPEAAVVHSALPAVLWRKPKFIVFFLILAVLFVLPRVAFLTPENVPFWQTATLCPPIIALMFSWAILTLPKDFRKAAKNSFVKLMKKGVCGGNGNEDDFIGNGNFAPVTVAKNLDNFVDRLGNVKRIG